MKFPIGFAFNDESKKVGMEPLVQQEQNADVKTNVENGFPGGDPFLVGIHYGGHNEDVCNLANLSHLNVEGEEREADPASVTADGETKGNQHSQKQEIENKQVVPFLQ